MIVIGDQQIAIEFYLVNLQSLRTYFFEGNVVFLLMKNCRPKIATIQSVIQSSGFIGSR